MTGKMCMTCDKEIHTLIVFCGEFYEMECSSLNVQASSLSTLLRHTRIRRCISFSNPTVFLDQKLHNSFQCCYS
ncbi:hypothetical protein YC2023_090732 [Brassica napus]